jgi:hypothetical protein
MVREKKYDLSLPSKLSKSLEEYKLIDTMCSFLLRNHLCCTLSAIHGLISGIITISLSELLRTLETMRAISPQIIQLTKIQSEDLSFEVSFLTNSTGSKV